MLHGMAQLRVRSLPALKAAQKFLIRRGSTFEAKQLAVAAWGLARLRAARPEPMAAVAQAAITGRLYLRPWSMAMLAGAYARANVRNPALMAAIAEVGGVCVCMCVRRGSSSSRGPGGSSIGGCAASCPAAHTGSQHPGPAHCSTHFPFPTLTHACTLRTTHAVHRPLPIPRTQPQVAVDQMRDFKPRELATLAWAYGHLAVPTPELTAALAARSLAQLEGFSALELGLLVQGLVRLRAAPAELLGAVAEGIACEAAVAATPADAARIVGAVGAAARRHAAAPGMAERLADAAAYAAPGAWASPRVAVGLAEGLARLGVRHEAALNAACDAAAASQLRGYSGEQAVGLLHACRALGHAPPVALCDVVGAALRTAFPAAGGGGAAGGDGAISEEGVGLRLSLDEGIDLAAELAAAGQLQPGHAAGVAAAAAAALEQQQLKLRKLAMLLRGASARNVTLTQPAVWALVGRAAALLSTPGSAEGLTGMAAGALALALARAQRASHPDVGDALMGGLYERAGSLAAAGALREDAAADMAAALAEGGAAGQVAFARQLEELAGREGWDEVTAALVGVAETEGPPGT